MNKIERAKYWLKIAIARELGYIDAGNGEEWAREEMVVWADALINSVYWPKLDSFDNVCRFIHGKGEFKGTVELYFQNPSLARRADEWPAWEAIKEYNAIENGATESDFVFHLDGKANGLQHMAAVLRDKKTAEAANILEISGRPKDPYGILSNSAQEFPQNTHPSGIAANQAVKTLGRDMAKTPLMILCYGASQNTIENNITNTLIKYHLSADARLVYKQYMTAVKEEFPATLLVTKLITEAMEKRLTVQFGPADDRGNRIRPLMINLQKGYRPDGCKRQDWKKVKKEGEYYVYADLRLREVGDEWMDQHGKTWQKELTDEDVAITWYTQDGFYCKQLEFNEEDALVRAGSIVVKTEEHCRYDYRKMLGAASPNFIHSIDANHARRTVIKCYFELLTIHDSYGCHITDVDKLIENITEAFVETHSYDALNHFLERIWLGDDQEKARHWVIPEFEIDECLKATYMFS